MNFELSEEQEMLRDGLRELLAGACDIRHVRAMAYDGDGRDPGLWEALAGAGWAGLAVPEAEGGAGLGFEELMVVAIEAGRAVLHLPLITTLLAARTVARGADAPFRRDVLSRIVAGTSSITLALRGSPDEWNGERPGCRAQRHGEQWRLSGEQAMVPFGPLPDLILLEAALSGGSPGLFVVPADAPGITWTDLGVMDLTVRQYRLALEGVTVPAEASIFRIEDAGPAIERLLDEWRTALAAETLGAAERMLERSVAYAKERMQFGRPIGSNQAVKARIAEMAAAVERMRAAVFHAAMKIQANADDLSIAAAMAKAATAVPGVYVGTQAIHVHGGIGFTWEHDMHLYFKRIKSNELLLGDGTTSLRRIADRVV